MPFTKDLIGAISSSANSSAGDKGAASTLNSIRSGTNSNQNASLVVQFHTRHSYLVAYPEDKAFRSEMLALARPDEVYVQLYRPDFAQPLHLFLKRLFTQLSEHLHENGMSANDV
jgi:hypothetical protein